MKTVKVGKQVRLSTRIQDHVDNIQPSFLDSAENSENKRSQNVDNLTQLSIIGSSFREIRSEGRLPCQGLSVDSQGGPVD